MTMPRSLLLRLCVAATCAAVGAGGKAQVTDARASLSATQDGSIAHQFEHQMRGARGMAGTATMGIVFDDDSLLLFDLVHAAPKPRYKPQGSKAQRFMQHVKNIDLSSAGFTLTFTDGSSASFDLGKSVSTQRMH